MAFLPLAGAISSAATAVAPYATLAGIGMKAYGDYQASQQQAAIDEYNARVKELEARAEEQRAILESRRQAQAAARKMSELQSLLGASGAVSTAGSPLEILAEQAKELQMEQRTIGYEGTMAAARARQEAKLLKQQAKTERKAGMLKAGTTLLTGFGSTF